MKRFLVPFAALTVLAAGPSCASPQPEYLYLETLQNAEQERREFRLSIRRNFAAFHQLCPQPAPESRRQIFAQSLEELENFLASLQSTSLFLDMTITYEDATYDLGHRRAVIKCRVDTMTEQQADAALAMRTAAIEEIRAAANTALEAIHE